MRHIEAVLKLARARRATWVEVTQEALDDFQASISRSGANLNRYFTVNCAGSNSYFINSQGDTPYVRPWTVLQSYRRSVQFPATAYEFKRISSPVKEIEHAV
ncbi:Probable monooxygenase [Mycobacteroides abscessus subsp. abscessus]|nr:Probable monooxygenase [Mycobacteroides abscessus subsp. abscessus]SLE28886.1 cyclohexanone monooxygenase [Mycobacteroides abscessus subsp. massiliense]